MIKTLLTLVANYKSNLYEQSCIITNSCIFNWL